MIRRFSPAIALLLGMLAQLAPGAAQAAGRVALVIGNADYADAPLRNPVNDARAMADQLEEFGFEVIRLENATKEEMERAIVDLVARLDPDSSALFYYAGHGVQVRGRNYLVPVDASIDVEHEVRIESVGVNLLLDELAYAGNRLNIVILDACRNNPFERRIRGMSRGLAAVDAARGTLIAYATAPSSVAMDGEGENGLYTEALLRALDRPGLKAEEVFKQVRVEVARRTRNQQIPWESSSMTGDFVFNSQAPKPATRASETAFWESVERLGTLEGYRAYLAQFPGGVFETIAKLRIAELEGGERPPAPSPPEPAPGPLAMLDEKPDEPLEPDARPRRDEAREPYTVAIMPAEGRSWVCSEPFNETPVVEAFRRRMRADGIESVLASSLEAEGSATQEMWRAAGVRKVPDADAVYGYGERLGVDGVLAVWYEQSGPFCSRLDLDIRLFDIGLRRRYREQGGNDSGGIADVLVSRFVEARRSAGGRVTGAAAKTRVPSPRLDVTATSPAAPGTRTQGEEARYEIGVAPPEGAAWMCHEPFDPEPMLTTFTEQLSARGVAPQRHAYPDTPSEFGPEELWRSSGLRKRPDAQTAYRHARRLGVDALLVVWYEISGWQCDRLEVDVRIFDAALEKTYREQATNTDIEQAAETLVARFLEGRALAGRTP